MLVSIDARYIRERPSGIGSYVRALVDRLPALEPAARFHIWIDRRARRPLTASPNVTETVVGAEANSPATLIWPARLADLRGAGVLHAPFNILGRGIPCASVVTVHDLMWVIAPGAAEPVSILSPLRALFYRDGILRALRRATRLIAISEATAAAIRAVAPDASARVRVIPHGIDARFRPPASLEAARARAAALLGTEMPYFLVIGQNSPYKNHEGILEAFAAADLPPEVRLVLLQRLYASRRLARRARALGVSRRVIWLHGAGSDDVVALLQAALALVQFSRFEGFGMPAVEAIACGTPVVASDIAPLVEVLGGAALHVPLAPRLLSAALTRVTRDPALRAELSARGVERAASFSWDRCAAAHMEVYRDAYGEVYASEANVSD
jgi:glycosyltransferase involved in cell wall biosynthesis